MMFCYVFCKNRMINKRWRFGMEIKFRSKMSAFSVGDPPSTTGCVHIWLELKESACYGSV